MVITMSFDRMGRRVTKNDQRFVYDGYLQIADNTGKAYVWDPTEPIATRPLVWNRNDSVCYYTHDGNKNVSEVISADGSLSAHYEYAPFGAVTAQSGALASVNPFRFSSEYAEDDLSLVYYNYRHYQPIDGRWLSRDPINESGGLGLYLMCYSDVIGKIDFIGLRRFISGHRKPLRKGNVILPDFEKAREIMRAMERLKTYVDISGRHCFSVELRDFVTADVKEVLNELKLNRDNVFIISHGTLRVNGESWHKWDYIWNSEDVVEEGFCRDGIKDFISFKEFEKNIKPDNVFACYIGGKVRKVKKGVLWWGWTQSSKSKTLHNLIDILSRLKSYEEQWLKQHGTIDCSCPTKIIIYEGDEGRGTPDFGTNEAMKYPLMDETFYGGL